jgi:hypothetical protein
VVIALKNLLTGLLRVLSVVLLDKTDALSDLKLNALRCQTVTAIGTSDGLGRKSKEAIGMHQC